MPKLEKYRSTFRDKEQLFVQKLDETLKEEFVELVDDYFTCFPIEMAEEFARGFKMAVCLGCEIFYGDNIRLDNKTEKQEHQ